jgi:hypothetical protein
MSGAILLASLVRVAVRLQERAGYQTAVDATALSAATAYSRGLNIAAESNNLLMMAAGTDAFLKVCGVGLVEKAVAKLGLKTAARAVDAPTSFTEMVVLFQDAFIGSMPGRPAVIPVLMGTSTAGIGSMNGLQVLAFWNGKTGVDGLVPDLGLYRAGLADLAGWANGGPAGRPGMRIGYEKKQTEKVFSYKDSKTGQRVFVGKERVEGIMITQKEKIRNQFRLKGKEGNLAGKFVKMDTVTKKVLDFIDVPFPLMEREAVHEVLVVGIPAGKPTVGGGNMPYASRADSSGGEVFNGLGGSAGYEARMVRTAMPGADYGSMLEILSSPGGWKSAVRQAACSAAMGWAGSLARPTAAGRIGGV